jgi:hypothetical protein
MRPRHRDVGDEPRWYEYTICTAVAPDAVFTVRTYATGTLYNPGLVHKSAQPATRLRRSASCQAFRAAGGVTSQVSCPQTLVTLGYGFCGELCEVGGSPPVDFRHRVGVVPQCGRSTAAMAKTRSGVAQVKPPREQLARRVVP